jgi:hypothetical protein
MGAVSFLGLFANSDYKPVDPAMQLLLITFPGMIIGFLGITLKCECCGGGLFDLKNERSLDSFKKLFSLNTYIVPKKCSKCGCERY